MKKQES